jgi:hypothetical protein
MKLSWRRNVFQACGLMELAGAAIILLIGLWLPDQQEVEAVFGSAHQMAAISRRHVDSVKVRTQTLQEGTHELTQAIGEISTALDGVAKLEIPSVSLSGLVPRVVSKRLWPAEQNPAERFRKFAAATTAGEEVFSGLLRDLPALDDSLEEMESALDQYGNRTARSLSYVRWLMWMIAPLVALHAVYMIFQETATGFPSRDATLPDTSRNASRDG